MQQFSFLHFVKGLLACSLLLFTTSSLCAQVKLPEVPKASEKHFDIDGKYIPRDNFLKNNPQFSKDGIYFFDFDQNIKKQADEGYYLGAHQFNSEDYPATEEPSKKNLSGLGKILIQLTTDTSESSYIWWIGTWVSQNYPAKSKTDIYKYPNSTDLQERYEVLNSSYHESVNEVFKKAGADNFSISDALSFQFEKESSFNSSLIFQFVFVQGSAFWSKKTSSSFPSHALYKLLVKDLSGNLIKSYGQAIFFEGNGWGSTGTFVLRKTLSIAMENLINRFLNDDASVKIAKQKVQEDIVAKSIDQHQDSLYTYKQQYNYIQSKKQQLLFDLSTLEKEYVSIAKSNKERETAVMNRERSFDNNLLTSLISGMNYGSMATDIRKRLEVAQKKLIVLRQIAFSLNQEEKKYIQEISSAFDNSFELSFILGSKENDDTQINGLFSKLSSQKDETSVAFQKTTTMISNDFGSSFTNNLSSFINSATGNSSTFPSTTSTASPNAETMATTNGGGNMDACMQKANSEWYKSAEYIRYKKTGLNSDAYDSEAKIMELTIQYCGDKLPQKDHTLIKQQAVKDRQLADQIRSSNKFNLKP